MDSSGTGLDAEGLEGSALVGEVVGPARGSMAWLESLPTVVVAGRELPAAHRVPEGSSWRDDSERGMRCALVKPGGVACGAPATRRYGVCFVHAGGGSDPRELAGKAAAANTRLRVKRELLGIGPRSSGSPRAIARLAAIERADDVAAALFAPLDARGLGPMDRQRAAVTILGETFPLATATLEVSMPADAGEVSALGWSELQALAARVLEPVPNQEP